MKITQRHGYAGIQHDAYGGMIPAGTLIRDAWVFDLRGEDDTCAGWTPMMEDD